MRCLFCDGWRGETAWEAAKVAQVLVRVNCAYPDGTFGIFFARSFAITETGRMELTPYPIDDIIVAGGAKRTLPVRAARKPAAGMAARKKPAKKAARRR